MKKFINEFKEFISRGNVMDMAVGVIIGALGEGEGAATLNYGAFLAAVINFLLIAFVIFMLIKTLNKLSKKKEETPAPVTTKDCPYCKEKIAIGATKCPHCTSQLDS